MIAWKQVLEPDVGTMFEFVRSTLENIASFFSFQMKTFIEIRRCTVIIRLHWNQLTFFDSLTRSRHSLIDYIHCICVCLINVLFMLISILMIQYFSNANRIESIEKHIKNEKEKSLHSHPRTMNHGFMDVNRYALDKFITVCNKRKSFDKRCDNKKCMIFFQRTSVLMHMCFSVFIPIQL